LSVHDCRVQRAHVYAVGEPQPRRRVKRLLPALRHDHGVVCYLRAGQRARRYVLNVLLMDDGRRHVCAPHHSLADAVAVALLLYRHQLRLVLQDAAGDMTDRLSALLLHAGVRVAELL
jgi:hypothetical protein